ncbi:hypothetical protein ACRXCV_00385 (plasmid) [Halobacteriovorax sp. GFR7]|uniref:hypothetical protein n=1 Tax=unclassified Halobacteriovorax TaxID=2639665 RepID=UPI003D96196B
MEVNIDGTGFYFVDENGEMVDDDDPAVKQYWDFAEYIYPHTDLLSLRRLIRRDLEETGNYFLEVIRNILGEITFVRRVAPEDMRLCKLSEPTEKTLTIERKGVETTVKMMVRERRFAQVVSKTPVYFAEFGASRKLDKVTGRWEGEAVGQGEDSGKTKVPPDRVATEIIHGTLDRDSKTPYGLPRWISSHRAVRGQVEAEELNLAFFDSGGVPPVLVAITGGTLTESARNALQMIFSGTAKQKLEGAVIEAEATGGSVEKDGNVNMEVHQFGDKNDSMFENYDDKCESKIRKTFRLPKLFMGDIDGINFATAYTMYMVTETQVFEPERLEFDTIINRTVFADEKTFTAGYRLKSKPLNLKNVENRLKAIEMAKREGGVTVEHFIDLLNQETDLNMTYDETKLDEEENKNFEKQQKRIDAALEKQGGTPDPLNTKNTSKQSPVNAPTKKGDFAPKRSVLELIELSTLVTKACFDGDVALVKEVGDEILGLTANDYMTVRKLSYYNLLHNNVDGNALALVFPDWEGVENG